MAIRIRNSEQGSFSSQIAWETVRRVVPQIDRYPEAYRGFEIIIEARENGVGPTTLGNKLVDAKTWICSQTTPENERAQLMTLAENIALM